MQLLATWSAKIRSTLSVSRSEVRSPQCHSISRRRDRSYSIPTNTLLLCLSLVTVCHYSVASAELYTVTLTALNTVKLYDVHWQEGLLLHVFQTPSTLCHVYFVDLKKTTAVTLNGCHVPTGWCLPKNRYCSASAWQILKFFWHGNK